MRLTGYLVVIACATACGGRQETTERAAQPRRPARPVIARQPVAPAPEPVQPAAPPASGEQQPGAYVPSAADQVLVRRMLDIIDQVAAVMDRQQNACDRMAADLDLILQRNQDLMVLGKQMKGNTAREKWMQDQLMERLNTALPRMMTGFQKCQNDPSMQALARKLAS
jgi:hypothetical protein